MVANVSTNLFKTWRIQDLASKAIILVSLLLIVFAYLPTLQFDYVTQDQWRAFRYSTEEKSPIERAKACVRMLPEFYVATGRPLVWITECVEHAAVAKISDFSYLRPVALLIVIVTAIILGNAMAPSVGGLAMGVMAASAFLMSPGYSFMYLQCLPAAMVLISIILAASSFKYCREWAFNFGSVEKQKWHLLLTPLILFLLGCFIYPAWTFSVIALVLLAVGLDDKSNALTKLKRLSLMLTFYFVGAIFYYLCVKAMTTVLFRISGAVPDLGGYNVSMQLNPRIILDRITQAVNYLYSMPPSNYFAPSGIMFILLGLFSFNAVWQEGKYISKNLFFVVTVFTLIFITSCAVLLASISPWLFSQMDVLSTRHVIPWYLFFCGSTVGLIYSVSKKLTFKFSKYASLIVLVIILIPISAIQNKLSFMEISVTNAEIQAIRSKLSEWIEQKGYSSQRYLLIVLPTLHRPTNVESLFGSIQNPQQNAVLSGSQNPVSIPWMLNAIIREFKNQPVGKTIKITDCADSQDCINNVLLNKNKVALGYTVGDKTIVSRENPFVINLSFLTSKPVVPKIEIGNFPDIKATSQLGEYGPEGLFSQMEPGWHAERNPQYPQSLIIDYHEMHIIKMIGLLPQDSSYRRAPKTIIVSKSNDGKTWVRVSTDEDVCNKNALESWHLVNMEQPFKSRYLKIDILKNCGDPDFLTLRGLKIE